MALDSQHDSEAATLPISLHPAFPGFVALWFAALLGLGSLVLPAVLLDRVVASTGLGSLIPAAGPPLGTSARALVAIGGALAGAVIGVVIARRVATRQGPGNLASGSRRPINVHDELGGEGVVNGESLPINRRRAIAISEDDRPSDFLYRAPLPGDDLDAPAPFAAAPIVSAVPDDEPLELRELAHVHGPDDTDEDFPMTECEPANERAAPDNLAGQGGVEPLPFAAPSLVRRGPRSEGEPHPEARLEAVAISVQAADERVEIRADWQTAPLDGLGLVQLVQRLGSTIERRRELTARAAVEPSAEQPSLAGFVEADFEPAAPAEAVQAMAAFFGSAPAAEAAPEQPSDVAVPGTPAPALRPEFLRSLSLHDEDDGEDAICHVPPLRRQAATFSPAHDDATEDEGDGESEQGFGSLLGMSSPLASSKSELSCMEEPEEGAEPVVSSGNQDPAAARDGRLFDPPRNTAASPPPAPADTDAALRAALATLQRMSGAV